MLTEIIILSILIILSGLFSGIETAFVTISPIKARSIRDQKIKNGELLYKLKKNQRRTIIGILIGNNLVNIGASAYATYSLVQLFGGAGVGIATGTMTFLILTFGEILPKTYFAKNADKLILKVIKIIYFIQLVLLPLILLFEIISNIFKIDTTDNNAISENDIQAMIAVGTETEILHTKQKQLLYSVFDFDDTKVKEIMTPRIEVFGLEEKEQIKDVIKKIKIAGFSRIPVYKERIDNITGYIHIRDLLSPNSKFLFVDDLKSQIEFISGEKIIQELFLEFQKTRNHIAVVVDEFGGTAGIVTLEDVLEELVGDIKDESDKEEASISKINAKTFIIRGDTYIDEVNEFIKIKIPENREFTTISGYIQHKIKNLPKKGEEIIDNRRKIKIKIIEMKDHSVEKIQLTKL